MGSHIRIKHAVYLGDYKIKITFTDGKVNVFDYKPLVTSGHEEFSQYLDVTEFKKFKVSRHKDDIHWKKNDEMVLSLDTLYSKKTVRVKRLAKK